MFHTNHFPSQKRWTSVVLFLVLLAFVVRIHNLDAQALSSDEAFTVVVWTTQTLNQLLTQTSLIDPQPPATLLGITTWLRLAGTTEFASRYISLLASLITLTSLYKITDSLLDKRTALLCGLLAVINPFHLWYAQDIRSYSLWMAASTFSMLTLLKVLNRPDNIGRLALYIFATTFGLYTYYLEVFFVFSHNVFAVFHSLQTKRFRSTMRYWIPAQLAIGLLAALWYMRPELRSSGYHPTAVIRADIPWLFETLSFGATLPPILKDSLFTLGAQHFSITSIFPILFFLGGLISLLIARHIRAAWFVACFTFLPMLLLTILTTKTGLGFFRPRYLAPASIVLIIAFAALLVHLQRSGPLQAAISGILALLIASASITSTWWYKTQDPKSPPWREVAAFLESQPAPNDFIVRNFPDPAFDYYYKGQLDSALLPITPDTPTTQTFQELTSLTQQFDALWFMPVPYVSHDPEQIVSHWLYDNDQLVSEHWFDSTHIIQFADWDVDPSVIEHPLHIIYAQTAILRGYNITPTQDRWTVGQPVTVELFWQPIEQTEPLLTIFFHVLAVNDNDDVILLTQDDQWPQEGRVTTQTWEPGKLYRDVHMITLPPSPTGTLTFSTGFYNAETSERITPDPASSTHLVDPDSPLLFTYTYQ